MADKNTMTMQGTSFSGIGSKMFSGIRGISNSPLQDNGINYTGFKADLNNYLNPLTFGIFGGNTKYTRGNASITRDKYGQNDTLIKSGIGDNTKYFTGMDNYNFALQNGLIDKNTTYQDFANNKELFDASRDSYIAQNGLTESTLAGTKGSWANVANMAENILNIGGGIADIYTGWNAYNTNKDLMKKNKELLEQQIQKNRDDMQYAKEERARLGTMRSNAQAQRSSTSNIRSF